MRSAEALLAWFDRHKRDLPWRRTTDPYRVWLSEVMLQQTRVETVIPYFERFLRRFPTVEALAAASIDDVLALWSGLGYYRRARQLHAAALAVARRGRFPGSIEELRALPGVGDYTAAAVASIAFGIAAPVMDGNVERVLSRVLAQEASPKDRRARLLLLAAARDLLVPERPGDSNQALMELGATLCAPRRPRCLLCPLETACAGARTGEPERFPVPRAKRAGELFRLLSVVVEEQGRFLLFRRPESAALLAGTWELPWMILESEAGLEPRLPEAVLGERYGGSWRLGEPIGAVRHGITFRDLEVAVRRGEISGGGEVREGVEAGWFDDDGWRALPTSSLVGKVLALATPGRPARRFPTRRR
jgi:A/G-specific adenine glycosylase